MLDDLYWVMSYSRWKDERFWPLFRAALLREHAAAGNAVTVLTTRAPDPTGYGRIVRDDGGSLAEIVEEARAHGGGERLHCLGREAQRDVLVVVLQRAGDREEAAVN